MANEWLLFLGSPACIFILGGGLLGFLSRKLANCFIILIPLVVLYIIWGIPREAGMDMFMLHMAGFDLLPLHVHGYTHIFATIFTIAALAGGIFALKQAELKEIAAAYVYAGGAIGVTFSGDFFSLFAYWEIMAIASTVVVLCGDTEKSLRAAVRYAVMHFFGGIILLIGIIAYHAAYGNIALASMVVNELNLQAILQWDKGSIAAWCILVGVLVNAAAPPFSAWLSDAYPEASPSGAVFLSAFTTKTAVYVLLTLFSGNDLLLYIGLFMVFYGIIYGVLENDIRRILAYSIISQVGFMLVGISVGTEFALQGVALHAFCHIIYKALLMMSAGSVVYMTGRSKATELGGMAVSMKWTALCGIIGVMTIAAVPFTSGFISKSIISSAVAKFYPLEIWGLLLLATVGTAIYAGLRFPWLVFFRPYTGPKPKDPPWNMRLAMGVLALLCVLPGIFPHMIYAMLPAIPAYNPNTPGHIIGQLQLIAFAGLAFMILLPLLRPRDRITLDMDWFYRILAFNLLKLVDRLVLLVTDVMRGMTIKRLQRLWGDLHIMNGPDGVLARNWPIGTTVMWIILLLGTSLLLYYTEL